MKLLYRQEKGHLGQYEDWWHLHTDESGKHSVVHSWDHVTVNGLGHNDGENRYSVEDFLAGEHHGNAKDALKKELGL